MSNDVDRPCCGQFDAKVGWPGHCKAASFTTLPNEAMWKGLQPHQQSETPNDPSVTWLNHAESVFERAKYAWIKARRLHSILRLFWNCHVAFFRACLWAPCIYEHWLILFTKSCINRLPCQNQRGSSLSSWHFGPGKDQNIRSTTSSATVPEGEPWHQHPAILHLDD